MRRVAEFSKVSFEQFKKDWIDCFQGQYHHNPEIANEEIKDIYEKIPLPKRATKGSAGYDFYAPIGITLRPHETIKLPTGIRCRIADGWVLKCYPRSGQGFKYRLQLNNTVGIIDSDYFYSENEGHIMIKLTNDSNEGKTFMVEQGGGMMQGIFVEYGITFDDNAKEIRNGGFGSTDKESEDK